MVRIKLLVAILYTLIFNSHHIIAQVIHFESFDTVEEKFTTDYTYDDATVGPGEYVISKTPEVHNITFINVKENKKLSQGNFLLIDGHSEKGKKVYCSRIKNTAESVYNFSFSITSVNRNDQNFSVIQLMIDDISYGYYEVDDNEWYIHTWEVKLGAKTDSVEICLIDTVTAHMGNDFGLDNITIEKVKSDCPYAGDTIKGLVHFPFDESKLTEYSSKKLEKILSIAKECPDARIEIRGHADIHGEDQYNIKLSEARCLSVKDYLISSGLDEKTFLLKGYGEKIPVYTGSSFKDHVANRRVEFVIHEK